MLVVISELVVGFLNTMLDALEMGIYTRCWMVVLMNGCDLGEWKWCYYQKDLDWRIMFLQPSLVLLSIWFVLLDIS